MLEFSEDFFKEEIRCDFVISSMMKKAWAAQMEVLQIVGDICKESGLQYFADSGTLLGAVRHQGFIPWDDDIDISLKREEYNELIRILPEKLPKGFKLAGIHATPSDPNKVFPGFYSRVGSDGAVWGLKEHMERFYGFPYPEIGIDIFCYDYLPRDREAEEVQNVILEYGRSLFGHWDMLQQDNENELEYRLQKIEEMCGAAIPREGNVRWNLQKLLESVAALFQEEESDEMTIALSTARTRRGMEFRVRKECFEKAAYMPFEQIEIAVPCGYHEVLTAMYGDDYMTFKRETVGHEYPFYATEEKKLLCAIRGIGFEGTVEEFCRKVSAGEIDVQMM